MKKILIVFLSIFLISQAKAQVTEGVVKYICTQNWPKKMKPLTYISKQERENMEYQYGNRAEWKNAHILYFNANESKYEDSDEKVDKDDDNYNWRKTTYTIYRNFEKNTMNDAIEMLGKVYLLEDSINVISWKIGNDLKEVAGHICMNAFTEDKSKFQKITAWYALDIPVKAGPERFNGLPGLILELDINDGGATYVAQSVVTKKLTNELELPKKMKGKKVNNYGYREVLEKHIENMVKEEGFPYWGIRY